MLPKKVMVCVGTDEQKLSVRAFLFATRGYRVAKAATAEEALALLRIDGLRGAHQVDLLIVDLPLDGAAGLIEEAKRLDRWLRTLLTSDHSGFYDALGADGILVREYTVADLFERAHILLTRKRGPRKVDGASHFAEEVA